PLPMPSELYRQEFSTAEALQNFDRLIAAANLVFELNQDPIDDEPGQVDLPGVGRSAYAQLGIFLSAHCHVLLAIWDGKTTAEIGGTSQVVHFHHNDYMPGVTEKISAAQRDLADDESDLVFHVVCSRNRANGDPPPELKVLDWYWYSKDPLIPLSKEIPDQHRKIFLRGSEFSEDAKRNYHRIQAEKQTLVSEQARQELPESVSSIDRLFGIADWLAVYYKKLTIRTLLATHVAAFLMGLMFLLYSDFETRPLFMALFLLFFGCAAMTHWFARRQAWHRKYLEYRTLAEGLRVQFYWAAAGIRNEAKWRFAHDSYLQTQDPEFGWIRHVMRVAGTRYDAQPTRTDFGLDYAIREWVGGGAQGQLGYYKKVATDRMRKDVITKLFDRTSLLVSGAAVVVFLSIGSSLSEKQFTILFLIMGTTLLLYAIREGYSYATAVRELIKQYEFMLRIFDSAHRRLSDANDADVKRQVLMALG
ncbi:MAG: hypothetical protein RL120_19085, partial [Gammaproteobacteria bacterium]